MSYSLVMILLVVTKDNEKWRPHLYIYTDDSIFIPLNSTKPASVLCVSFTTDNNDIIHHNFLSVASL